MHFFSLEILCPDLTDPEYGSVNQTSNKPGSTAHYECDYGFKLVGNRYRVCLYNGYWEGNEPVCKRKHISYLTLMKQSNKNIFQQQSNATF